MVQRIVLAASLLMTAFRASAADFTLGIRTDAPATPVSRFMTGVCLEDVNHEVYGGIYSQMIFGESFAEPGSKAAPDVSGMWRPATGGSAKGSFAIEAGRPFVGRQCQRLTFEGGDGFIGVENRGLNRQGLCFVAGRPYDGYVWVRADKPVDLFVTARDGDRIPAEAKIAVAGADWKRYDFALTPATAVTGGRLVLELREPGTVFLGHVFLEPGEWGRFAGLPVRRDVADVLKSAGVTVVRYGGSMVNAPEYRWKKMIGARDRRQPYVGNWYPYSSNGWGVPDFLNFAEALDVLAIPDFNADETAADMADFVEYANGPAGSEWGRRRAADGHPKPYGLKYLEFGNEEKVDDDYARKFEAVAAAVWAKDPAITIVVGDFDYREPITDPDHVRGGHVTNLAGHKRILDFAKAHGRAVWFDVHIWNDTPADPDVQLNVLPTYIAALAKICPGADFKVCVFEENANHHGLRRAVAHAKTVSILERMGDRVPIVCSANALQVDGQNDNGWDQGLVFLNPARVWLQPPGCVTKMLADAYRPACVPVDGASGDLTATALAGTDTIALQITNGGDRWVRTAVQAAGQRLKTATATQIRGNWDEVNTAEHPDRVVPWSRELAGNEDGMIECEIPPRSFTVVVLPRVHR
jgi:alpha-L-arabinofuranosidase